MRRSRSTARYQSSRSAALAAEPSSATGGASQHRDRSESAGGAVAARGLFDSRCAIVQLLVFRPWSAYPLDGSGDGGVLSQREPERERRLQYLHSGQGSFQWNCRRDWCCEIFRFAARRAGERGRGQRRRLSGTGAEFNRIQLGCRRGPLIRRAFYRDRPRRRTSMLELRMRLSGRRKANSWRRG